MAVAEVLFACCVVAPSPISMSTSTSALASTAGASPALGSGCAAGDDMVVRRGEDCATRDGDLCDATTDVTGERSVDGSGS